MAAPLSTESFAHEGIEEDITQDDLLALGVEQPQWKALMDAISSGRAVPAAIGAIFPDGLRYPLHKPRGVRVKHEIRYRIHPSPAPSVDSGYYSARPSSGSSSSSCPVGEPLTPFMWFGNGKEPVHSYTRFSDSIRYEIWREESGLETMPKSLDTAEDATTPKEFKFMMKHGGGREGHTISSRQRHIGSTLLSPDEEHNPEAGTLLRSCHDLLTVSNKEYLNMIENRTQFVTKREESGLPISQSKISSANIQVDDDQVTATDHIIEPTSAVSATHDGNISSTTSDGDSISDSIRSSVQEGQPSSPETSLDGLESHREPEDTDISDDSSHDGAEQHYRLTRNLIDRILGQCLTILLASRHFWYRTPLCDAHEGSNNDHVTHESAVASGLNQGDQSNGTSYRSGSGKRKEHDAGNQDNQKGPRKKRRWRTAEDDNNERLPLFACPYYKHDRQRYQRCRSCPGPGWETIHRLKEHLYRTHKLPIHCPRCRQRFQTETLLLEHHRTPTSCTLRGKPSYEGFDIIQERKLRSRKKEAQQTEEDKWRKTYLILFPDDDAADMPSPYYDDMVESSAASNSTSTSAQDFNMYEAFLQQELPLLVRQELDLRFDEAADGGLENLRLHLPTIFRDVQVRLLRIYMQRHRAPVFATPSMNSQPGLDRTGDIFAPPVTSSFPSHSMFEPVHGADVGLWDWESVFPAFVGSYSELSNTNDA